MMQIQVNTDGNIEGRDKLAEHVRSVIEGALDRFGDRVTRMEVHLSDQQADKSGRGSKRCTMEARLKGRQPTAVTHDAATLDQAIDGATSRIQRAIDRAMERQHYRG